jgi:23S rRNA pseudouridine955/2504/2580 synthase
VKKQQAKQHAKNLRKDRKGERRNRGSEPVTRAGAGKPKPAGKKPGAKPGPKKTGPKPGPKARP